MSKRSFLDGPSWAVLALLLLAGLLILAAWLDPLHLVSWLTLASLC